MRVWQYGFIRTIALITIFETIPLHAIPNFYRDLSEVGTSRTSWEISICTILLEVIGEPQAVATSLVIVAGLPQVPHSR